MVYNTTAEIKNALEGRVLNWDDFYTNESQSKWNSLISRLEKQTRAIINNQIGGATLEQQTGRVDVVDAPTNIVLQLNWPVNNIQKVERMVTDTWKTVDSNDYMKLDHGIKLLGRSTRFGKNNFGLPRNRYGQRNPLRKKTDRNTWDEVGEKIRVTYDRGFATIPEDIKEIQINMIVRWLLQKKQDQNLQNMSPTDVENLGGRNLLTEDLKDRLGKITRPKNKWVML